MGTIILLGAIAGALIGWGAGRSATEQACACIGASVWCAVGYLIGVTP